MVEKSSSPRSNEGLKKKDGLANEHEKKKSIARNREGLINKCTKPCQVGRNHFVAYTHHSLPLSLGLSRSVPVCSYRGRPDLAISLFIFVGFSLLAVNVLLYTRIGVERGEEESRLTQGKKGL